jgi:2-(1,2-epoxy-1,2-dihydrophenyl)acetyl-CoA isomerase
MEAIRVERSGGLVTITLARPEKKNALNAQAWVELERTFAEVAVDPDARALILTGAGGNFSAGADLCCGGSVSARPRSWRSSPTSSTRRRPRGSGW